MIYLFIYYFIYLFIHLLFIYYYYLLFIYLYLLAVSGLHCCARAFSNCVKWGQLFVAVLQLLGHMCSVIVAYQLSCSEACGIFLDDRTHVPCIGRQIPIHYPVPPETSLLI